MTTAATILSHAIAQVPTLALTVNGDVNGNKANGLEKRTAYSVAKALGVDVREVYHADTLRPLRQAINERRQALQSARPRRAVAAPAVKPTPRPKVEAPVLAFTTDHLTARPAGATLLANLQDADVQAYRLEDGQEFLAIGGQVVNLDPAKHHHPTQMVINLAWHGKRDRKAAMERLLAL